MFKIISIEGNIGSGKSTFVNYLKNKCEVELNNDNIIFIDEPVDDWMTIQDKKGETILTKFYKDNYKYGFSFQIMAYISRLAKLKEKIDFIKNKNDNKMYYLITERSLYTDKNVFAKMLYDNEKIEEVNYQIYLKWFETFIKDIDINYFVYISCNPEINYERIIKRNREGENIPLEYLRDCSNYHDNWISNENMKNRVLQLDGNINIENNEGYEPWFIQMLEFIKYEE